GDCESADCPFSETYGFTSCVLESAGLTGPQLGEERFGFFQISRIEAFDEPAGNRLQEGMGLWGFALVVPMLSEGGGSAQLPPTGLLLLRDRQCPPQCSFRLSFLAQAQQHLAPHTIQLSFKEPLVC